MINHNHFPARWLDVLDAMIEKGKGNKINELRAMKIIEADFQLLMRMFLELRIVDNHEGDKRTSKLDHGYRKGCSIDFAILEKTIDF